MRRSIVTAVGLSLLLLACGDDTTINNYISPNSGTIIGRLAPPDPGEIILTGDTAYSTVSNDDGRFTFSAVQPGSYTLEVRPVQYSIRKLSAFKISPNQLLDLGEITLSQYPYPIYMTVPTSGDESVHPSLRGIQIYVDEPLNLHDLQAGSHVSPPLNGHWTEFILPFPFAGLRSNYEFVSDAPVLALATRYELSIESTVRTKAGVPIGENILVEFMTQSLRVNWISPRPGYEGKAGLTDFRARIAFNAAIDVDSLNKAAVFEPELDGIWIRESSLSVTTFLPTLPNSLKGSTSYRLIVADNVALSGSATLSSPDTTIFETEPYRVEVVEPCNGCMTYGYGLVRIEFNTAMDTASVESAFSVRLVGDSAIEGEYQWRGSNRVMLFWTLNRSLERGRVYQISLPRNVLTADGDTLLDGVESYFTTESD